MILQNLRAAFKIYANFDEGEVVMSPAQQLKSLARDEYVEQFEGRDRSLTDIDQEERARHLDNGVSMVNIN